MLIISKAAHGEKTYVISIGTEFAWGEQYQVAAHNEAEAINKVADHIDDIGAKGLYYDHLEVEMMGKYSSYKTVEEFAKANNLTCCGSRNIYIEITKIQEVSNA